MWIGEKLMNSTDKNPSNAEKKKLFEISGKLFETGRCREIMSTRFESADSYFCDRANLRLFASELFSYDFGSPAELRNMLQQMWKYQGCDYMQEFAVPATIAAFHNKVEDPVDTQGEIPSFIYNF